MATGQRAARLGGFLALLKAFGWIDLERIREKLTKLPAGRHEQSIRVEDEEESETDIDNLESVAGRLLDISEGGAAIRGDLPLRSGDRLDFWSADNRIVISTLTAGVVSVEREENEPPVFHLPFIDPDLRELRLAMDDIKERSEPSRYSLEPSRYSLCLSQHEGGCQQQPRGDEGDATQGSDGAEPAGACEAQEVEAAAKQDDPAGHQPAGPLGQIGVRQQGGHEGGRDQSQGVVEVILSRRLEDVEHLGRKTRFERVSAEGAQGHGHGRVETAQDGK